MDTALRRSPLSKEVGVLEESLFKGGMMLAYELPKLPAGIIKRLQFNGIYSLSDLIRYSEEDLAEKEKIGSYSVGEIKKALEAEGYSLPEKTKRFTPYSGDLRDEFAKAVIAGIFAGNWGQMPNRKPEQAFADIAYLVADEMLKRRLK